MFTLRELCADDIFPMVSILSKIGIDEIRELFTSDSAKKAIKIAMKKDDGETDYESAGIQIMMDVASVVMKNLPKCREEIYVLLSQLSGKKVEEIGKLPMAEFTAMIVALVKKREFADFFTEVAKFAD